MDKYHIIRLIIQTLAIAASKFPTGSKGIGMYWVMFAQDHSKISEVGNGMYWEKYSCNVAANQWGDGTMLNISWESLIVMSQIPSEIASIPISEWWFSYIILMGSWRDLTNQNGDLTIS